MYNPSVIGIMDKVTQAAKQRQCVTLTYTDSKQKSSVREVEPYEFKDDKLYAFCIVAQGIRAFKLEQIHSAEITGRAFEPRFEVKIE